MGVEERGPTSVGEATEVRFASLEVFDGDRGGYRLPSEALVLMVPRMTVLLSTE